MNCPPSRIHCGQVRCFLMASSMISRVVLGSARKKQVSAYPFPVFFG